MDKETKQMFEIIIGKIDGVDKRLDSMDKRFDGIDERLSIMEKRQDEMYRMQRRKYKNYKSRTGETYLHSIRYTSKLVKMSQKVEKHDEFIKQIKAIQ